MQLPDVKNIIKNSKSELIQELEENLDACEDLAGLIDKSNYGRSTNYNKKKVEL